MESQRVRAITEGYLRGWLKFDYTQKTSWLREELIIRHVEESFLYDLLKQKLFIETVIRSSLENKTPKLFAPVFDVSKLLISLKLPSLVAEDTIKEDSAELTKRDLDEWKDFLQKVNTK